MFSKLLVKSLQVYPGFRCHDGHSEKQKQNSGDQLLLKRMALGPVRQTPQGSKLGRAEEDDAGQEARTCVHHQEPVIWKI